MINWFIKQCSKLPKYPSDKWAHFIVSLLMGLISGCFSQNGIVLFPAIFICVGKEIYDINKTGFSVEDLAADSLGLLMGFEFAILLQMIF